MEALLTFLAQTIGSSVIGYYINSRLEKIDEKLPALLKNKSPREVERYIIENGIEKDVNKLALDTINNSYFIPNVSGSLARNEDKAELFAQVLRFGFEFSHKMKVDLLLPGSIIGPEHLTLFAGNRVGTPKINRNGLISSIEFVLLGKNVAYIVPSEIVKNKSEVVEMYISRINDLREETEDYLPYTKTTMLPDLSNFMIDKVSAGSCYFRYSSIHEELLKKHFRSYRDGGVKIESWYNGIVKMLELPARIPQIGTLSPEQAKNISEVYQRMKQFY